jgi:hypothetical protein
MAKAWTSGRKIKLRQLFNQRNRIQALYQVLDSRRQSIKAYGRSLSFAHIKENNSLLAMTAVAVYIRQDRFHIVLVRTRLQLAYLVWRIPLCRILEKEHLWAESATTSAQRTRDTSALPRPTEVRKSQWLAKASSAREPPAPGGPGLWLLSR